jgi:N-acetylglutamate synthase-like GNAT family acetyltransferase
MNIRHARPEEINKAIPLLKEFFPVHNIFTRNDFIIVKYLSKFLRDILVAEENGEIVGFLAIQRQGQDHVVACFKHIAAKNEDKEIIKALVKEAEKQCKAAKIELNVADGEKIPYTFFEELGYELEGKLKSHYRPGETCYVVGKVLK